MNSFVSTTAIEAQSQAAASEEVVRLTDVKRRFGATAALDGVSLTVKRGEILGIIGRSGAGKSTLIRCLNGLERPDSGEVFIEGREISRLGERDLQPLRRRIGMIFQHFNLLSAKTVEDNVALPLKIEGRPKAERLQRAAELLDLVGLSEKAKAYPASLSGGQKQRVGIARALAARPALLLSDEATSALDPETTRSILALLKDINRQLGLTILLITHEMNVIKSICDSAAIMRDGLIEESGAIPELIAKPGSRLTAELFPLPAPEPGTVTITFTGQADEPVVSQMVRRFDVDVNILGGVLEEVAGVSAGRLRLRLTGAERAAALAYLSERGLLVEEAPAAERAGASGISVTSQVEEIA